MSQAPEMARRWGIQNEHGLPTIPLYPQLHRGVIAITVLSATSFIASTTLFLYLTFKFILWRFFYVRKCPGGTVQQARPVRMPGDETQQQHEQPPDPSRHSQQTKDFVLGIDGIFTDDSKPEEQRIDTTADHESCQAETLDLPSAKRPLNQFLVLIYNLLLADMHQSAAFGLDASWLIKKRIVAGTSTCWAQGLLVSLGDLSSSVFITAIAAHTYLSIVRGYQPPQKVLYVVILGLWIFIYLISIIPAFTTKSGFRTNNFFAPSGAWCWVNAEYKTIRLVTHYAYLFSGLTITSAIYGAIIVHLRRRVRAQRALDTAAGRDTKVLLSQNAAFLAYPIIYVSCTLPVAIGRISSMAGANVPIEYFCFSGALIAFNGFFDCLLFGTTRSSIIFGSTAEMDMEDTGLNTFAFLKTPISRRYGNIIWVQGGGHARTSDRSPVGRRWPWQRLAGRSDTSEYRRDMSQSEQSLRGSNAIQMDMVTSVVVETEHDIDRDRRYPSAQSTT